MACSAPVFAVFACYERVKARRDGSPLVPLSLFRDRAFSAGMAVAVTFFLGIASFGLVLTLFLQLGLGFTPLHAGLTFLPFSLGVLASSGAAARLAPRFGRSVTMAGALIIAAAMASLSVIVDHYGATVTTWELAPSLVAAGLGLGAVIAPLADIVLAGVPQREAGSASGVFNTGLQVGNSIGIAVIGVIFFGCSAASPGPRPPRSPRSCAPGWPRPACQPATPSPSSPSSVPACTPGWSPPTPRSPRRPAGPGGAGQVLPAAAHQVLARVGGLAVRRDFAAALARTLWFQVGVFGLRVPVMCAPRRSGPPSGRSSPIPSGLGGSSRSPHRIRSDPGARTPVPGSPVASGPVTRRPTRGHGVTAADGYGRSQAMRLAILGATGGIGSYLLSWAVDAGHPVHVLARDPAAVPRRNRVTVTQGTPLTRRRWPTRWPAPTPCCPCSARAARSRRTCWPPPRAMW